MRDHPRSRGEYAGLLDADQSRLGSSPLSRGIRDPVAQPHRTCRIIPALAGNTCAAGTWGPCSGDHPRSRGEYRTSRMASPMSCGSSPLSRGIRPHVTSVPPTTRIIPALAGNTHPDPTGTTAPRGSSPLSRGIPGQHRIPGRIVRIIPALAGNTSLPRVRAVTCTDHPRSRGEYPRHSPIVCVARGSSPLSRGILAPRDRGSDAGRIIPALAGNTAESSCRCRACTDHPRSRGEYLLPESFGGGESGSSPLSRGIRLWRRPLREPLGIIPALAGNTQRGALVAAGGGIIPALAGNTRAPSSPRTVSWDHPRSRGEYAPKLYYGSVDEGSSPLSRGILGVGMRECDNGGIIPALAGNTSCWRPGTPGRRDHPRSRGEYINTLRANGSFDGSSPLSRGIRTRSRRVAPVRRIIPALAGNTSSRCCGRSAVRDHPRSRGEYFSTGFEPWSAHGSSPLSRGIPTHIPITILHLGIIPALAGNTGAGDVLENGGEDHPRSRGEYVCGDVLYENRSGSSPLSRGIHERRVHGHIGHRIIPALAGNTSSG